MTPLPALRLARALAFGAGLAAAAFCAAQGSGTIPARPVMPPEIPNPSLARPPAVTTPLPSAPTVVPAPATGAPAPTTPALAPLPDASAPAPRVAPSDVDIALVLPLKSPDYARAAEAVQAGFEAAAKGTALRIRVLAHGDGGVEQAFADARASGARIVVGPLVRDDLRTLVGSSAPLPPTIALNQLDDGGELPPSMYTLTLSIEADGRVLARRAHDDGVRAVAIIGGDTPLMRRFATAFVAEWRAQGGPTPNSYPFDPTPDGLGTLRREIVRSNADAVLIAVDGADVGLARSFAPRMTAYASPLVQSVMSGAYLRDLEDVRFVDVPWLLTPDAPALASLPRLEFGSPALDRLYALGLDAFRVARVFIDGTPPDFAMDGATGHLTLPRGRHIVREGAMGVVRGGEVVPLER